MEGFVLFIVLFMLSKKESIRNRPGILMGVFFLGYALARSFVELFRQPDAHIGLLAAGLTMGQWLSVPMIIGGLYFIMTSKRD